MAAQAGQRQSRILPSLAIGTGAWFVLDSYGLPMESVLAHPVPAGAAALLGVSILAASADTLRLVARFLDWRKARTPTGLKGTSGWVRSLREIRHDLLPTGWGPFWGTFRGKPIFADYASNALTAAPAGAGKSVSVAIPMILAIRESKTVVDLKCELCASTARILRERGETVHIVNLADVWLKLLGKSADYNILNLIADDFHKYADGLLDVSDDVFELTMQIYPEPASAGASGTDNTFFRGGSRRLIAFNAITCILYFGYDASLADVLERLQDRQLAHREALLGCGRLDAAGNGETIPALPIHDSPWAAKHSPEVLEGFAAYYRSLAASVADLYSAKDDRTLMSFLEGARQALGRFNPSTRASRKTSGRSTFRFAEQKESKNPVTVFIVGDASRTEALKDQFGLLQWAMITELKRSPNKHRPVYLICDEATNFKINGLPSLLTFGRGYGLRLHIIIQSIAAFIRVYGEEALATLWSETEVKQFLSGQREEAILQKIESLLGQQPVMVRGDRSARSQGAFGLGDHDLREEGRPLMTADEIRRTDKTILIIRKNKPVLSDNPTVAEIHPWRKMIDINPFHGKPFLRTVRLRLGRRGSGLLARLAAWIAGC